MTRRVRMVLVCEDKQHHVFARRFLKKMNWNVSQLRIEVAPAGTGAADQFVKARYARELQELRQGATLLIMLDGDAKGLRGRIRELEATRSEARIQPRGRDRVFVFVPTWNIETWLEYLGGSSVDETKSDYPRLDRQRECETHAAALAKMCHAGELRQPAPSSLTAACEEYRRLETSYQQGSHR